MSSGGRYIWNPKTRRYEWRKGVRVRYEWVEEWEEWDEEEWDNPFYDNDMFVADLFGGSGSGKSKVSRRRRKRDTDVPLENVDAAYRALEELALRGDPDAARLLDEERRRTQEEYGRTGKINVRTDLLQELWRRKRQRGSERDSDGELRSLPPGRGKER